MTTISVLALLAWLWLLAFHGRFWRVDPPSGPAPAPKAWPEVVAAIPARNEAAVIGRTIASLAAQDYPGRFSIVVADDRSDDGTARVVEAMAAAKGMADRVDVVEVPPLPGGWTGKMWAQSRAVAAALERHPEADLILLTDADIEHARDTLSRMVPRLVSERLDMASQMVRLATNSLAEKLIVPAFVFFFRLLYPFQWVADPMRKTAAAAGGCILIRRPVLQAIGGLEAIKGALIDDCALAAKVKATGGRIALDLTWDTHSIRSYPDARGLWMMIARTAFTQLNHSPWLLAGTVLAMIAGFLVPPLAFLVKGSFAGFLAWAAMSVAYAPMLAFYRLPVLMAPLLPLVAMFYLGATVDSARRHWLGRGGEWKGRTGTGDPS